MRAKGGGAEGAMGTVDKEGLKTHNKN